MSSASFRANTAALAAYFPKDSSAIGWRLDGVAMRRNNVAREEKAVRRVTVSKLKKRPADEGIEALVRERVARWGGGKPRGARRPPKIKGPSVADAVIQDRR